MVLHISGAAGDLVEVGLCDGGGNLGYCKGGAFGMGERGSRSNKVGKLIVVEGVAGKGKVQNLEHCIGVAENLGWWFG